MYSKAYYKIYQNLPEKLTTQYTTLNFDNHCYLRIALDSTFGAQWDTKLKRPAYKYLSTNNLETVLKLLNRYVSDKELLLQHHQKSLKWRKETKEAEQQLQLFD